jgi:F0F1-type ATP synthase assembly protein I
MQPRKRIGFVTLIILGLGIGIFLKNVKIGLIVGLMLGLLAGGLLSSSTKK